MFELIISGGVAGPCVYLNDYRIAGPKPLGGGKTLYRFKVDPKDIATALKEPQDNDH